MTPMDPEADPNPRLRALITMAQWAEIQRRDKERDAE